MPEWQSSWFYSNRGPRVLSLRGPPASGVGQAQSNLHSQSTQRVNARQVFCAGQNAGKASGALGLVSRACSSRWACRPTGVRRAREWLCAGVFGSARAAGVLAAVQVLWLAKCCVCWFGHCVQSVCSQGVCSGRVRFRARLEGCGQAIRAGGVRSGVRAARVGGQWARGDPV